MWLEHDIRIMGDELKYKFLVEHNKEMLQQEGIKKNINWRFNHILDNIKFLSTNIENEMKTIFNDNQNTLKGFFYTFIKPFNKITNDISDDEIITFLLQLLNVENDITNDDHSAKCRSIAELIKVIYKNRCDRWTIDVYH
ncbi:hypothetical protein [Candidatus Mycoplasma mahonii]|uniref:hypothetical protein n=1 Tax=Candidatus Mycoplasma mahonii TaxID=3004105 RepID=UPI0026ED25F4|nr:hypothetical protein [Candidatus Mycoplasma mahonii]WKX02777.1 hypothetical protein O3I44_01745 [Candidatus Mycoplasma mahonii]